LLEQKRGYILGRDEIDVLALWYVVLFCVRVRLRFVLHSTWVCAISVVTFTFAIFCASLRYIRLTKYCEVINSSLIC